MDRDKGSGEDRLIIKDTDLPPAAPGANDKRLSSYDRPAEQCWRQSADHEAFAKVAPLSIAATVTHVKYRANP